MGHDTPINIVGENAVDGTSLLALPPRGKNDIRTPDFVNMRAIIARALAVYVAYPRMQNAIGQLFVNGNGSPDMHLIGIEGYHMDGRTLLFAAVVHIVKAKSRDDICLGYITDSGMKLGPELSSSRTYTKGDRLVIITREEIHG